MQPLLKSRREPLLGFCDIHPLLRGTISYTSHRANASAILSIAPLSAVVLTKLP